MTRPPAVPANGSLPEEIVALFSSSSAAQPARPTGLTFRAPPEVEVDCVLFDVYGTLVISASGDVGSAQTSSSTDLFRRALEGAGVTLLTEGAAAAAERGYFDNIRQSHRIDRARGTDHPEVDITEIWAATLDELTEARQIADGGATPAPVEASSRRREVAQRVAAWYEALSNPVSPMPGARETLSALSQAGLPLGIVSNAQFYTPLLFPALFGASHTELGFREELCVWSYRARRAKPSVKLFAPVLDHLRSEGIAAERVLYVGNDMLNDVWTAHRAGCRTALFAGDRRSLRLRADDPRCEGLQPDMVLTDLTNLLIPLGMKRPGTTKGTLG